MLHHVAFQFCMHHAAGWSDAVSLSNCFLRQRCGVIIIHIMPLDGVSYYAAGWSFLRQRCAWSRSCRLVHAAQLGQFN